MSVYSYKVLYRGEGDVDCRETETRSFTVIESVETQPETQAGSLQIITPSGGETYTVDTPTAINWIASGVPSVRIDISSDGGSSWETIVESFDSEYGYSWNPPFPSSHFIIRVSAVENPEISSESKEFTVKAIDVSTDTENISQESTFIRSFPFSTNFDGGSEGFVGEIHDNVSDVAWSNDEGVNDSGCIKINNAGSSEAHYFIQFKYVGWDIKIKKKYMVSFMAKATKPSVVPFAFIRDISPWDNWAWTIVNIEGNWQEYTFPLVIKEDAEVDPALARFTIEHGLNTDTTLYIDDLKITAITDDSDNEHSSETKETPEEPLMYSSKIEIVVPESVKAGETFIGELYGSDIDNVTAISGSILASNCTVDTIEPGDFFGDNALFLGSENEFGIGLMGKYGVSGNGVIATIKLTAPIDCNDGDKMNFTLTDMHALDSEGNHIDFECIGGSTAIKMGITVFPGDANNDSTVNMDDLDTVLDFYGEKGPARPGATMNFIPQLCDPWSNPLSTHGDCDGNGEINTRDVIVICWNYGLNTFDTNKIALKQQSRTEERPILIPRIQHLSENTFIVKTFTGSTKIRGISFDIKYDSDKFELVSSKPGEMIAGNSDVIFFQKGNSVAICGKHVNILTDETQSLCDFSFKVLDDQLESQIPFKVDDITGIDHSGNLYTVEAHETWFEKFYISEDFTMEAFSLSQNSPNPFNPVTSIPFSLGKESEVTLAVYNIAGEKVATLADNRFSAGSHNVSWEASGYASGVYFYRITAGEYTETKKMILIK